MNILAISTSPRKGGNSDTLLATAIVGAQTAGVSVNKLYVSDLNIKSCLGCLRCNVLGRCAIKGDDWPDFSEQFISADAVLIAAPVYFWYVPGTFKVLIDRFRSLIKVTMGAQHITCTPREWKPKNFGFILVQGEPTDDDFAPALQMLRTFAEKTSRGGRIVGELIAKGPALKGQVAMDTKELAGLFAKVGLPTDEEFVKSEYVRYIGYITQAWELGREIAAG